MADTAYPTGSLPLFPAVVTHVQDEPPPAVPVVHVPTHYYIGGASGVWRSPDRPDLKPDFV